MAPAELDALASQVEANPEGIEIATSLAQARSAGSPPPVPLVVLARDLPDFPPTRPTAETERVWRELQEALAASVPQGRLAVAGGSGHLIPFQRPDAVVVVIRQVIGAVTPPAADATPEE
jgi:hypothetical protein